MGREIQKKKNRSSDPKVRNKKKGLLSNGKKKINIYGNQIISDNWDRKATLSQNYRRLGLTSRLNKTTGGVEKTASSNTTSRPATKGFATTDPLHINLHGSSSNNLSSTALEPAEVRVERDPETGKILRVIHDTQDDQDSHILVAGKLRDRANPLNDPLNAVADDEYNQTRSNPADDGDDEFTGFDDPVPASTSSNPIISALEAQAAAEAEVVAQRKPRTQSKREEEWLERLVEKYGDDYKGMFRDRKLNPMQQSEGDLKRRVKKWRASRG